MVSLWRDDCSAWTFVSRIRENDQFLATVRLKAKSKGYKRSSPVIFRSTPFLGQLNSPKAVTNLGRNAYIAKNKLIFGHISQRGITVAEKPFSVLIN